MSRMIDADAFRRELDKHWPFTKEEQAKHGIADMAKSEVLYVLALMPTIEPPTETKWIPIKTHPATEEEKESYPDIDYWFDCLMPDDGEEILVTVKDSKGRCLVEKDVCYVDDCYWLDSGYDWLTDVVAWKPLPEPYTEDEE